MGGERPKAEALGYLEARAAATAKTTARQRQLQLQMQKRIPFGDDKQEKQLQRQELAACKGILSHPCRGEAAPWMGDPSG